MRCFPKYSRFWWILDFGLGAFSLWMSVCISENLKVSKIRNTFGSKHRASAGNHSSYELMCVMLCNAQKLAFHGSSPPTNLSFCCLFCDALWAFDVGVGVDVDDSPIVQHSQYWALRRLRGFCINCYPLQKEAFLTKIESNTDLQVWAYYLESSLTTWYLSDTIIIFPRACDLPSSGLLTMFIDQSWNPSNGAGLTCAHTHEATILLVDASCQASWYRSIQSWSWFIFAAIW